MDDRAAKGLSVGKTANDAATYRAMLNTGLFDGRAVTCDQPGIPECARGVMDKKGNIVCKGCKASHAPANFAMHCGSRAKRPAQHIW